MPLSSTDGGSFHFISFHFISLVGPTGYRKNNYEGGARIGFGPKRRQFRGQQVDAVGGVQQVDAAGVVASGVEEECRWPAELERDDAFRVVSASA